MASDDAYKRLAQLYDVMISDMHLCRVVLAKILEDYDNLDYELPANTFFQTEKPELLNCTALELAVKVDAVKVFNFLIDCGADYTRKNKQGLTVLHQTIDPLMYSDDVTHMIFDDRLPTNLITESVLDAHVRLLNSSNPHDEHGLSHFHVACMTNHVEAVQFFLKAGVSSNQAIGNDSTILPGFTPLHLAVKFGSVACLQLLLETDVKIDAKNAKGVSALELLMRDKMEIWIERRKLTESTSHIHGYFDQNVEMTDMILRKLDPQTQVVDETTGLSRFHIACTTTNPQLVREQLQLLPDLQHSVDAKSRLWPGYTALHFAAHYDFEVFDILLDAGADLTSVDSKGQTPFDICLRNFNLREIEAILRRTDDWANVRFANGKTWLLDFVVALQKPEEFEAFLKDNLADVNTRIPEDSALCRGWRPLHLAVACCERFLETSVHRYRICLEACFKLGADVTAKNSQGSTPLHLAFHLDSVDLIRGLLERQTSAENPWDNAGLSHLHLASLADYPGLVEKMPLGSDDLEAPIEIGDFVWAKLGLIRNGDTPLNITRRVGARKAAEALIERGVRISVDDAKSLATISEAKLLLRLHPQDVERVLRHCEPRFLVAELKGSSQLRDYLVERHGLTRLHVAVLLGEDIDGLTEDANVRVPFDSPVWPDCTALHLLMVDRRFPEAVTVAQQLLDRGADVTLKNARGATPVHDAFDWYLQDVDISRLFDTLLRQIDANPSDPRGISHFHIAAALNRVNVVEGFLRNGVDVHMKTDEFWYRFSGFTALHFAAAGGCNDVIETLLANGADVNCKDVVGNRPIHLVAYYTDMPIESTMKILMSAGADINAENLFGETPLEKALLLGDEIVERVKLLLKYGCKVNTVNSMSHVGCLALALLLEEKSVYKSMIDAYEHDSRDERNAIHNIMLMNQSVWDLPKNNIEKCHIPITDYVLAIQELTSMGLDIDSHDKQGMTPLHEASLRQNVTGVMALLMCGADINVKDKFGRPSIMASICHFHGGTPPNAQDHAIAAHFWVHIWKLRFFKLHVSDFNLEMENNIDGPEAFKARVIQRCHAEIESMGKEKIGSIALREFLCETGVVAAYPTMLHDLRCSIDEFFDINFERLLEEFPELSVLLSLQYRKARKRRDMADSYTAALRLLVNFEIPHLCSDRILRFLTYDELENLIVSASFE